MTGRGIIGPEFRGGQMGGSMDNMGLMRRQQDMLRQMQNRGGFQTQGPESFDRRAKLRPDIARLPRMLSQMDLSKAQARLQQQQGGRPMPRAITGREQLMRRRSPVYQGPVEGVPIPIDMPRLGAM